MQLVMGNAVPLGKITAALGEDAGMLSDNALSFKSLGQVAQTRKTAESRSKPWLSRVSGPPPAPMRM
jgi:hypothetical protein